VPSFIKTVTFDCGDPLAAAGFWAEALGLDEGNEFCVE